MDPIYKENDRWYFWDETWTNFFGPFNTREEASKMLDNYARYLDTGEQ